MTRKLVLLGLLFACSTALLAQTDAKRDQGLVGVWGAEQTLGPRVRGILTIHGRRTQWRARISGFDMPVERNGAGLGFSLPRGLGEFRGRVERSSNEISGEWIQPAGVVNNNRYATRVRLKAMNATVWKGEVVPLEDRISFYVSIKSQPDGAMRAVIINPEYNLFRRRSYVVTLDGSSISFRNPKRPDDNFTGSYDQASDRLLLPLLDSYPPLLLSRRSDDAPGLYARTPASSKYEYTKPITGRDGWATASLADVGMAEKPLAALVEKILAADPTDNPLNIHSLLIARHGKLVFEEYFHGFDEERTHDMRSASKTFVPVLVGIARDHGWNVSPDTPVYSLFADEKPFANWDSRKSKVTLQALMTMTSGLACDDNDDASPGKEDTMQGQTAQPDWYKYTLDLPIVDEPGGKHAVYCSAGINLAGGAIGRATKSSLPEFFDEHLARPLQFQTYHMNLMPTGEAYMGGGLQLRARDELKLGQLYVSGGVWNHRRIVSQDWVEQSIKAHSIFDPQTDYDAPHEYGFGWHINHLRFGDRTFRAYSAGGNGGQIVMVIRELDLVVGLNGGSYGEFSKWYRWGLQMVPQYIIPAALSREEH